MNPRILIAVVVGLVLVAFGAFYFALGRDAERFSRQPRRRDRGASSAADCRSAASPPAPPRPRPPSIEAEIAPSEHAEAAGAAETELHR